jgi:POT family proton-dependent oligopeptide transporter
VKLQGVLMGTWMMVSGASVSLALYFVNSMTKAESTNPLITNVDYLHVFNQLCAWALGSALFLYLVSGKIRGLLDHTEQETPPLATVQLD